MAMAMAMAMAKQQRSKLIWEGMLKRCFLSALSDGTHRPAHSYGTHRPVPEGRWEAMLKRSGIKPLTPSTDENVYDRPVPNSRGEAQQLKYQPPRGIALTKQGGSNSNWEGVLKRLILDRSNDDRPHQWSEEYDIAARVYGMAKLYLKVPENENDLKIQLLHPEHFEYSLDELQEYVECMEIAHELHSIDCLIPLLHHVLYYPHDGIRAKAAELVTTMVSNNPSSQQLVIELKGLEPLLYNSTCDHNATSKTKALGAISALIRNNKPGITAFQLLNGYAELTNALSIVTESVMFQREALNLIQYLLHENSSHRNRFTELGLPRIMMHLASSDDAEVREAALRCLLVFTRDEGGNSGQLVKNDYKLKRVLQERIEVISAMTPKGLGAAREERLLLDSLWNACYNEPSSLGEKGLLVLPDEDAPAPDVTSNLFEPPLRAWAPAEAADGNSSAANGNSVSEKKDCNIITELGLPRIMMHLASSDDAEVRESALRGLLVLSRDEVAVQLVKNDKLKQVLQERIEQIREESHLVNSLWNAYYEPSLNIYGEDAPDPNFC